MFIFQYDVHESLSFWIIKQIYVIFFRFWLIGCCMQKTGFSRIFAGGTWKRRRTTFADFVKQIWKVLAQVSMVKVLDVFVDE
jgi:hypothetical protein